MRDLKSEIMCACEYVYVCVRARVCLWVLNDACGLLTVHCVDHEDVAHTTLCILAWRNGGRYAKSEKEKEKVKEKERKKKERAGGEMEKEKKRGEV